MKVRLLSLLSVVLVLSIKAYETTARELNDERRNIAIFQPRAEFGEGRVFENMTQVDSLVIILAESEAVKERYVGFSGYTPTEYKTFEELMEVASEDELNNLLTHSSPIVRVYAYRALLANEMEINLDYETSLMQDSTEVDWFSGCVLIPSFVGEIASEGFID